MAKNPEVNDRNRQLLAGMDPHKRNYTTGEVAAICDVAPRTVSKWFDSGALRGYRIPGSHDRRIPAAELVRFLREHRMDLGPLQAAYGARLLAVTADPAVLAALEALPVEALHVPGLFEAGEMLHLHGKPPAVLDLALGRAECLRALPHFGPAVLVCTEDEPDHQLTWLSSGYLNVRACVRHPFDPDDLARAVREMLAPTTLRREAA